VTRPATLLALVVMAAAAFGAYGTYQYAAAYDTNRGFGPPVYHQPPDRRGVVTTFWLRSSALGGRSRPVYVYLPAQYRKQPARRFPVLYLLHGMPGNGWDAYHLVFHSDPLLDDLIANGSVRPMIVVIVSGNFSRFDKATEWANGPAANAQWDTYLARDVVGGVDARFRTLRRPDARAIAGYSAGADGAINELVLHDEFTVAALWSADFRQDGAAVAHDRAIIRRYSAVYTLPPALGRLARRHVAVFMSAGSDEPAFADESWAARLFHASGISSTLLVVPHGGHSWRVWVTAFRPSLMFISAHLAGR
jgi:enterochelin esterase-like enzyme